MRDWVERIFVTECSQKYRAAEKNFVIVDIKFRSKVDNESVINLSGWLSCQSRLFGINLEFD